MDLGWLAAAVLGVYAVWSVVLLQDPIRFWRGDSQSAYYGWLWTLGDGLRHGDWPILSATNFSSGNHIAEGQMGLYNPLAWLFGLGATEAPDTVVYMTLVRFAIATIGIVGAFGLARSFGVRAPLAAASSMAVALCGLTMVAEAPRWMTGQLVAALLPWAWWLSRRTIAGRSPFPALVACGLVVSVGYVYGTLYLIVILVGLAAGTIATRDRRGFVRLFGIGVFAGLVAIVVYLPGVLTLPATLRRTGVGGDGRLRLWIWDYLYLNQPAAGTTQTPFTYMFWWIPLLGLVDWAGVRRQWRERLVLFAPLAIFIAWTLGPYEIGPIRWPGRTMDAFTLVAATSVVVLLQHHRAALTRRRVVLVLGIAAVSAVAALVKALDSHYLIQVGGALGAVLLVAVALRFADHLPRLGVALVLGSVAVGAFQAVALPEIPGPQRYMPADASSYPDYLPGTQGAVFVVGSGDLENRNSAWRFTSGRAEHLLTGSMWSLTGKPIVNSYTTIGFRGFSGRFCLDFTGESCTRALKAILKRDPRTGATWADLMNVSSLVVGLTSVTRAMPPPAGWHEVARNKFAVTWVRDQPLPLPGSVSWSAPGVRVTQLSRSDLTTTFRVDAVPATGGYVVLSRLDWPGNRIDGGSFGRPIDDSLVTVDLTPADVGTVVTVSYRPPGWNLELLAGFLALLLALTWIALHEVARIVRRSGTNRGSKRQESSGGE